MTSMSREEGMSRALRIGIGLAGLIPVVGVVGGVLVTAGVEGVAVGWIALDVGVAWVALVIWWARRVPGAVCLELKSLR